MGYTQEQVREAVGILVQASDSQVRTVLSGLGGASRVRITKGLQRVVDVLRDESERIMQDEVREMAERKRARAKARGIVENMGPCSRNGSW